MSAAGNPVCLSADLRMGVVDMGLQSRSRGTKNMGTTGSVVGCPGNQR